MSQLRCEIGTTFMDQVRFCVQKMGATTNLSEVNCSTGVRTTHSAASLPAPDTLETSWIMNRKGLSEAIIF